MTTLTAKTLSGLEDVLAAELKDLGAHNVKPKRRAVQFDGDDLLIYKSNLWCRSALSILKPVYKFTFESQQEYYDILRAYPWDELFAVDKTISINALAFSSVFSNTHFLAQRTKDAIADYFIDKAGKRPDVDLDDPQVKVNIFIQQNQCTVSLDSSGAPLFKRGYRRKSTTAPLNEVLAAGIIMISGWDKQQPLYDPMCGSGTFSIEAGMMAMNMAPAIFRKNFSFMHWNSFDAQGWDQMRESAAAETPGQSLPEIFASDISNLSMDAARQNIMEAGLLGRVRLEKKDFFASKPRHNNGTLVLNPPYGRRLQSPDISEYYQKIGATFKHNYPGFEAWVISPDKALTHKIGLKHTHRQTVFNGQIECQLLGYKLYQGTKRVRRKRIDPTKQ